MSRSIKTVQSVVDKISNHHMDSEANAIHANFFGGRFWSVK